MITPISPSLPSAQPSRRAPALALLVLAAGLFSACTRAPQLSTHAAGHTITAEVAGSPSIQTDAERAIVQSEFGQVTIERTRVRVDQQNWTGIPAEVAVKVSILRGRLHIEAGSVRIARTVRSN